MTDITQAHLDAADRLALDTGIAPKEERLRHALAAMLAALESPSPDLFEAAYRAYDLDMVERFTDQRHCMKVALAEAAAYLKA